MRPVNKGSRARSTVSGLGGTVSGLAASVASAVPVPGVGTLVASPLAAVGGGLAVGATPRTRRECNTGGGRHVCKAPF